MTAIDELRAELTKRGVEWAEYGDGYTLLRHGGREYTVQPNVCNRLIVTNLTPAQAIAATLGSGTLTAEQVREAWCRHLRRDCLYDPPTPNWQAIADELNADRGVNGATGERRDVARPCREVYLVEVSDDLLESWYTIAVYQCREAAESRAEALRREVDGVRHFVRVSKLKVVDA